MYAIIETGGKQVKVEKGQTIFVEKLSAEVGEKVTFDKVLFIGDGENPTVGSPLIEGATVTGTVEKQGKDKKIIVFKYKAKKNYRKKQGHRQPYTKIVIDEISVKGTKKAAASKKVEEAPAEEKKVAKKAAASKTTAEKKPAAKKTTTAKKPAAKKTTEKKED